MNPLEILIVDDTPMNLVLLEQLLKKHDCVVRMAENGHEAVELVREHDFALILLDIQMPGMDGYDTCRTIKEMDRGRHVPVIFITSIFQDEASVKLGYEAGAVDYLLRPVDPYMLRSKVKVFLDLHRQKTRLEHEIVRRKRAAEALGRAEERYRSFFVKAVEGIFQMRLDGTLIEANPALARVLGYECPDDMVEVPGLIQSMVLDAEQYRLYLETLDEEGYVSNWEYQVRRADGQIVWLSESSRLVRGGEEKVIEGVVEDVTARKTCELNLHRRANFDELTGVPNRTLFFDRLEHFLQSAERYGNKMAIFFIDLNNFKKINDGFGHQVGDEVLRSVAHRFGQRVRSADTLARIGGDEFGVLLSAVDSLENAEHVAQELLSSLEEPFDVAGEKHFVGATLGISMFPHDATTAGELLHLADTAMYAAKRSGRKWCSTSGE
ncbi:PAS domain S-box-containing protein/diguanylate cyclase (GGDEF) domain-containing protein [Paucidesulfovibrio gracilis DSM 16080]|uniref:PAS domain S-box-containing protein/diguanylate cyclase (GGDEF) domain-containing protein n=1 Tax=Paucidesulfovibrio gracilis DSM 16080 TaxID=1121449 RepID=A0A1T4X6E3_9BACT|nr:diguanylate cyclase [Paucidesulfovibrio gracilis]SKA84625.1 PAS domain S-box-containing protein/diguanylate cyclase (GGDEF) domain-containing protein [Paucidesulfovibrio gracilis DSM 16080]